MYRFALGASGDGDGAAWVAAYARRGDWNQRNHIGGAAERNTVYLYS
jgi:hypothetical protein